MKKSWLFVFLGLMVSVAPLQSGKPAAKKVAAASLGSKVLRGGSNNSDSGNTPTQYQPTPGPAPMPAPPAADPFSSPAASGKQAVRSGDPKKGAKVVPKKPADGFSDGYSKGFSEGFGKGFSDGYSKGFSDGRKTPESPVSNVG